MPKPLDKWLSRKINLAKESSKFGQSNSSEMSFNTNILCIFIVWALGLTFVLVARWLQSLHPEATSEAGEELKFSPFLHFSKAWELYPKPPSGLSLTHDWPKLYHMLMTKPKPARRVITMDVLDLTIYTSLPPHPPQHWGEDLPLMKGMTPKTQTKQSFSSSEGVGEMAAWREWQADTDIFHPHLWFSSYLPRCTITVLILTPLLSACPWNTGTLITQPDPLLFPMFAFCSVLY